MSKGKKKQKQNMRHGAAWGFPHQGKEAAAASESGGFLFSGMFSGVPAVVSTPDESLYALVLAKAWRRGWTADAERETDRQDFSPPSAPSRFN